MRFAAKVNDIIGDATVGPFLEADVPLDSRDTCPSPAETVSSSPLLFLRSEKNGKARREASASVFSFALSFSLSLSPSPLPFPHLDAGNATSCRSRYGIRRVRDRIGRTGRQVRREREGERVKESHGVLCRGDRPIECNARSAYVGFLTVEERTENLQGRFLSEIEKKTEEDGRRGGRETTTL